ncbi:peptidase S8/S53 domain-containing protein [Phlyctochytrium arcticum]|nr:peptidase S8/S53 domain-containing protein [Phlyctochytrium arcticum]
MTGVYDIGLDGAGVHIAIVDSGIDYTHPALGGCIGASCKITGGYDFVGDSFGGGMGDELVPDDDPMDCNGHGTHVAGIIAGSDNRVAGVAPNVTLASYKIFGCTGGTSTEAILLALEKVYEDGADIVNLSVGTPSGWNESPEALSASRLAEGGIMVVAAQGNDGTQGLWTSATPAIAPEALAVASCENTYFLGGFFTVSLEGSKNITYASTSDVQSLAADAPLLSISTNGCLPVTESLEQAVVLVKRGGCSFNKKAENLRDAGAVAMIVYNDRAGLYRFALDKPLTTLAVLSITDEDGQWLLQSISAASANLRVIWNGGLKVLDNPDGGHVADYSSWGPGPSLAVKPDLTAPGSIVYSTYLSANAYYYPLSGTSMATPYISGCLALLRQKLGTDFNMNDAFNRLRSTATIITSLNFSALASPVPSQGSGLVQVATAAQNPIFFTTSILQLGDSAYHVKNQTANLNLRNTGETDIEVEFSTRASASINITDVGNSPMEADSFALSILPDVPRLVIPAKSSANFSYSWTFPIGSNPAEHWILSGFLLATPLDPSVSAIHAAYVGLLGAYSDLPIFDSNGSSPSIRRQPDGAVFTKSTATDTGVENDTIRFQPGNGEALAIYIKLIFPVRQVEVELLEVDKTTSMGIIGRRSWMGRNVNEFPDYILRWQGAVFGTDGDASATLGNWVDQPEVEGGQGNSHMATQNQTTYIRLRFERDRPATPPGVTYPLSYIEWYSMPVIL